MTLLADMCEKSCTVGDGIVAIAIAAGIVGGLWAIGRLL